MVNKPTFSVRSAVGLLIASVLTGPCILNAHAAPPAEGQSRFRSMAQSQIPLGRTFDPATSGTINPAPRVPKPRIISKKEWGGGESSGTMRSQFPARLTLHHVATAAPLRAEDDPTSKLAGIQIYGWRDKGWPDLPYHYLLDLDGNIYEGRDVMKVGDTNTRYDPAGHFLVSMIGNYDIQAPNEKQLAAIADLMAWGSDYFNIDPGTIASHRDYVAGTQCPGRYLYPYISSGFLEGEVRRRIAEAYGTVPKKDAVSTSTRTTSSPR